MDRADRDSTFLKHHMLLPQDFPPGIPVGVVEIAQGFFGMIVAVSLGIPIIRALSRRFIDRPRATPIDSDLRLRLERIEQAIDAVAIEVERISEAQRFQARLMTEGRGAASSGSGSATESRSQGPSR
jgi:hypothetical protein